MIRPIAIYLPQFHPIAENDEWWGKGFTEWTNVAKAKPLFEGHYQPHLPADTGFYDLRVPETRELQAAMAKTYGIEGFCYYHYWFNGRRILERPFQEVFESGQPDFPFMLCWANENWTRVWDGGSKNILLEQNYSEEDDRAHIRSLIPYFKDSRYIKIDGKPVFSIYRSALLPNAKHTTNIWREEAAKEGLELYLCVFETTHLGADGVKGGGFDAAVDFKPFGNSLAAFQHNLNLEVRNSYSKRIKAKLEKLLYSQEKFKKIAEEKNLIFDYEDYATFCSNLELVNGYKYYPGITPMWDNSARRKSNYLIFKNSSPAAYKKWLMSIIKKFKPYSTEENFLFINAWNEWAEGNHLEPCQKWGLQYLEATKEALESASK